MCASVLRSMQTLFVAYICVFLKARLSSGMVCWLVGLSKCMFTLFSAPARWWTLLHSLSTLRNGTHHGRYVNNRKPLDEEKVSWWSRSLSFKCLPSNRFDDPESTLAENIEFLPNGDGKKPRFTDVSMCNICRELSSNQQHITINT